MSQSELSCSLQGSVRKSHLLHRATQILTFKIHFFNPNNGVRVIRPTDNGFESLEVESHTQSLRSLQSKPMITIGAKPCMWGGKTLFNCALTKHISQTTHLEDSRRKKGWMAKTSS